MENSNPLVSVFVVTYNAEEYICETLDSIKVQTYDNIELIVSDDHSSDNTVSRANTWIENNKERFVRTELITIDHNTGVSANYNRAVRACRGEWLKNVDGDDLLYNNCIELNIEFVKNNPNAKLVFSNVMDFSGSNPSVLLGEHIPEKDKYFFTLSAEEQFKTLLHTNILPSPSCFVKAELIRMYPYNEDYRGLEDEPMWLTLTRNGHKVYYFDVCTAYYRNGESTIYSSSRYYSPIYVESFCMLYWNDKFKYIKKYNLVEANNVNRRTMLMMDFAIYFLKNKKSRFHNLLLKIASHFIFYRVSFKL